eukprot:gene53846-45530_t
MLEHGILTSRPPTEQRRRDPIPPAFSASGNESCGSDVTVRRAIMAQRGVVAAAVTQTVNTASPYAPPPASSAKS